MNDTLSFLLKTLLLKENYKINFDELKLQLLSHPSYPSLHAMTGVLDHFDVDHLALEVPTNIETLKELPTYFLAFINAKGFAVVRQLKNSVELLYDSNVKENYAIDDFLSIWSGVILVVEKEMKESLDVKVNNKTATRALQILSGLLLVGLFFYGEPSLFESVYFIMSLVGLGVSVLILKHELGFQSKTIEKFCTATASSSCDDVLNSNGAIFFGFLKLSDLSIIYFSTLTVASIIAIFSAVTYNAFITITLLVIPISIYSIYYQYKTVKKWCPLCLTITVILWIQACCIFLSTTTITSIKFDISSNFILFFSVILMSAIWLFIKPLLKKQQNFQLLQVDHYKFKRNGELFKAALNSSEQINTRIDHHGEIVLGNKNVPISLLLVTSPSCYYCRAAHSDLEKILKKNPNEVNITIRFSVTEDPANIANRVAQRLLEIYNGGVISEITNSLHSAYEEGVDLEKWINTYGESSTSFETILKIQKDWCHHNGVHFTPALYINGKLFPRVYDRTDLSYFIEDVAEQLEVNQPIPSLETVN